MKTTYPLIVTLAVLTSPLATASVIVSDVVTFRFGVEADFAASTRIDTQHVDVAVGYVGGGVTNPTFEAIYDADVSGPVPAGDGHLYANASARLTMPPLSQFAFIGATPGSTIWALPQTSNPAVVWPGFNTEGTPPPVRGQTMLDWNPGDARHGANTDDRWVGIELLDMRGPSPDAEFSLYQIGTGGQPVVYMATSDGIDLDGLGGDDDVLYMSTPAHDHFNWVFTEPGLYELDFRLSTLIVPEPATLGVAMLSAPLMLAKRRDRRRSG